MNYSAIHRLRVAFLVAGLCLPQRPMQARQQAASQSTGQSNPAQQQTPPSSQPLLHSTSDLVRIDVEVTDRSGKPVKGLKADQFTITDDGQGQQVSIFSYEDIEAVETASEIDTKPIVIAVDSPSDAAAVSAGEQARDRRMLVLFFDLTSLGPDDIIRAHDAAAKFVREKHVTQMIFGRTATEGWQKLLYMNAISRFLRDAPAVDVHIVTQEPD